MTTTIDLAAAVRLVIVDTKLGYGDPDMGARTALSRARKECTLEDARGALTEPDDAELLAAYELVLPADEDAIDAAFVIAMRTPLN